MENIDYKKEYEKLISLWDKAFLAYNKDGMRQDARAREVLRILGFTTGKRTIKAPCLKFLTEYECLVAELSKMKRTFADKKKIIDDMAKKHKTSYGAIHKHLRDAITVNNNAIKEVYHSQPVLLEKALNRYRKILPPHK